MKFLSSRSTFALILFAPALNVSCVAAQTTAPVPAAPPVLLPTRQHDMTPLEMGANGKLIYRPYNAQGDKILDFSHCGYGGGGVKLPNVAAKVTVAPDVDDLDDTPRLQKAIDEICQMPLDAAGFRGAVLFTRGMYEMASGVKVRASGVVLRGEGNDEKGTVFFGTTAKPYNLVSFSGEATKPLPATEQKIGDDYVPLGSIKITVTDGTKFKAGDAVIVTRHSNPQWIREIGMDRIPLRDKSKPELTKQWKPFDLKFDRKVIAVDGNTLTLDAPMGSGIAKQWGGGSVVKYDGSGRISKVGIESIFASNSFDRKLTKKYGEETVFVDENHVKRFVDFDNAENVWARNLGTRFIEDVVRFGYGVKYGTVQDSYSIEPVSLLTGGRRYPFYSNGQLTLWQRLRARESRHAFVYSSVVAGPNVFLDCRATKEHSPSEAHHRWSVGGLYDNVHGKVAVNDRGNQGTGHGWGGANYVIWNGKGGLTLQSPPTAENFAFGFVGRLGKPRTGPMNAWFVSLNQHVAPRSLYLQQLEERLGTNAVQNIAAKK
jgi:hypothetical protein